MRIALLNVQFHEGNNVFPPLGLLYVAAVLREAGHTLLVLDEDPRLRPDVVERIAAFGPELVGLSFLTMTWDRARDVAAALRARLPGVPLLGGGAHTTADPEGSLRTMDLDFVVAGEGERAAVRLVEVLARGEPVRDIPGLWVRGGPPPAPAEPIDDLDALPLPARDLLGHEPYLRPPGLIRGYASSRIASVLASRGCPFACSFCASKQQLGRAVRFRSVDAVLAELDHLVAVDRIRGMYFVDDLFTHDRSWTMAFARALQERPYRLEWGCQARVDQVDGGLLEAMRDAGCVQVDFGVESGSARILKRMRKGIRPDQVVEAFSLARGLGLRTGASFVLGSPGETEEDLAETAALAERIRSDWTVFFLSTPYPGTPLWHAAEAHHEGYPEYGEAWNNRISTSPFAQGALPGDVLVRARAELQNRHFASNYLRRRNVPFILKLVPTLARLDVARTAVRVATRRGRLDDLVEAAFASWRAADA